MSIFCRSINSIRSTTTYQQVDDEPTGTPGVEEHHQRGQRHFFIPVFHRQRVLSYGGVGRGGDGQSHDACQWGGLPVKLHLPHRLGGGGAQDGVRDTEAGLGPEVLRWKFAWREETLRGSGTRLPLEQNSPSVHSYISHTPSIHLSRHPSIIPPYIHPSSQASKHPSIHRSLHPFILPYIHQ